MPWDRSSTIIAEDGRLDRLFLNVTRSSHRRADYFGSGALSKLPPLAILDGGVTCPPRSSLRAG